MIASLVILHFLADFVYQGREMGRKKSQELVWLVRHLNVQARVFYLGLLPFFLIGHISGPKFLFFPLSNVLIHGVIDWYVWRLYKYSVYIRDNTATESTWKYWEDHWFYVTIGFDQLLHILTLIGLWYAL